MELQDQADDVLTQRVSEELRIHLKEAKLLLETESKEQARIEADKARNVIEQLRKQLQALRAEVRVTVSGLG